MGVSTQKRSFVLVKYETEIHDRYVRINVTGQYDFDEMMGLVQPFRDAAIEAGRSRLLVDCTRMEGKVPESDKFFIGEKIAKTMRSDVRSSLLMPVGTVTKLGEMVAVNRGASFFVTDSEQEAVDWLFETSKEN